MGRPKKKPIPKDVALDEPRASPIEWGNRADPVTKEELDGLEPPKFLDRRPKNKS